MILSHTPGKSCYKDAMPKPPTSVRSIRLPDTEWRRLQAEAEAAGLTVNALVAQLVRGPGGKAAERVVKAKAGGVSGFDPLAGQPLAARGATPKKGPTPYTGRTPPTASPP